MSAKEHTEEISIREARQTADQACSATAPAIPEYLQKTYWWAYLHPNSIRIFDRKWLIDLILWGNFGRLRNHALSEAGNVLNDRLLQIACVYGDFTQRIAARLGEQGTLDIVDVAPIQLANLRGKLPPNDRIRLHCQDASSLQFSDASFDTTLIFFLLHEQPETVRRATLAEAIRVTRAGGKIIIIDYHKPKWRNPLRYIMMIVLPLLEPFACDLWREEIECYLPPQFKPGQIVKTAYFGDLYQKVVITC
jgi:ubiquinone/menaquinone biosynthesis C-methylase UbiE